MFNIKQQGLSTQIDQFDPIYSLFATMEEDPGSCPLAIWELHSSPWHVRSGYSRAQDLSQ